MVSTRSARANGPDVAGEWTEETASPQPRLKTPLAPWQRPSTGPAEPAAGLTSAPGAPRAASYVTPAPGLPQAPSSTSASSAASLSGRFVEEEEEGEEAARDRYSSAGRNPCPSALLNPRGRRQSCHAGERSSPKRRTRRGAGQPRERRLPGPRQAGPDPLQQHLGGQSGC